MTFLMRLVSKRRPTHIVNFHSEHSPIAFEVDSVEGREIAGKLSSVVCFKFYGVYIPCQNQRLKEALK